MVKFYVLMKLQILLFLQNLLGINSLDHCYEPLCCDLDEARAVMRMSVNENCFTGSGHKYRGRANVTNMGITCINWMNTSVVEMPDREKELYGIGEHNYCRNPDPTGTNKPWCYVSPRNYGYCVVEACPPDSDISLKNQRQSFKIFECAEDEKKIESKSSDILFTSKDTYYLITNRHAPTNLAGYTIYKFHDENMTSFEVPMVQTLQGALNLCIDGNDVITFATSDNQNKTYFYMQSKNIMVQVDWERRGWIKVKPRVYELCLNSILQSAKLDNNKEIAIKTIFNFMNPKQLILMTHRHVFECQWKDGILGLVRQETIEFNKCLNSNIIIATKGNISYVITTKANKHNGNETNLANFIGGSRKANSTDIEIQSIICSNESLVVSGDCALSIKPALAAILMGYEILNNNTLVKLQESNSDDVNKKKAMLCPPTSDRKRLFRVYSGKQLEGICHWLSNQNIVISLNVHSIYIRRPGFCKNSTNACCQDFQHQFEVERKSKGFTQLSNKNNQAAWIKCLLQNRNVPGCPILSCYGKIDDQHQRSLALYETKLAPDSFNGEVSLEEILETSDGSSVHYVSTKDASTKIGQIADSIRSSLHPENLGLGLLYSSIEALQPLNFDELQQSESKLFINDFLMIVDHLADNNRAKDWVEAKKADLSANNLNDTQNRDNFSTRNPLSLLFITENVLERVASMENMWSDLTDVFEVATKNVITRAQRQHLNNNISGSNMQPNTNYDIKVMSSNVDLSAPAVIVTSLFPHILQMISNVEEEVFKEKCTNDSKTCRPNNQQFAVPNSPVLATSVLQNQSKLPAGVKFQVPFSRSSLPNPQKNQEKYYLSCSYLSDKNTWNTKGCLVRYSGLSNDTVQCVCNHTTNFAIILQVVKPQISDDDQSFLSLISFIGESLSTFCLVVTVTILGIFRQSLKSDRIIAHFNLMVALILFHAVQLFSYTAEKWRNISTTPCISVAFLSHFSLLAAFMWMLCEGITLHFGVVDVFNPHSTFKVMRFIVGWGIPLMVASSSLVYGLHTNPFPTCYVQGIGEYSCSANSNMEKLVTSQQLDPDPEQQLVERCWLSVNNYLILALFVPVVIILAINTVITIRVSLLIAESSKAVDCIHRPSSEIKEKNLKYFKKSLKGVIVLMPILGVSWIFGVIPQSLTHVAFLYVFAILNSTQGVFLLLFYCVLNNEVRNVIARSLRKRKLLFYQQSFVTQQTHCRNQSFDFRPKYDGDTDQRASLTVYRSVSADTNNAGKATDQPLVSRDSNEDSGYFLPELDFPVPSLPTDTNDPVFTPPVVFSDNEFGVETVI